MSPELEALLRADYERNNCEPSDHAHYNVLFECLLEDALRHAPAGTTRKIMLEALITRRAEFRRSQRKTPTIPPKA